MTFVLGMITGGALLYGALNYHVVRAKDGFHFIAKTRSGLADTYVDIRDFRVADLANHPDLVEALVRANKGDLTLNTAADALQNGIDRFLDRNGAK